ncbi:hypothetical protein Mapa_010126 [Marchantia paleacea]|nr:hypothetical protein Mapa_010126 [Marchantia paleacea]
MFDCVDRLSDWTERSLRECSMANLRSSRSVLVRVAGACGFGSSSGSGSASLRGISSAGSVVSNDSRSYFSSSSSKMSAAAAWRSLLYPPVNPSAGVALIPAPVIFSLQSRSYAKRPKKWQGVPHAFVQVESGVPVLPYQPNEGSVKNRKHKKRMAQRDAFAKTQAQKRKAETKAAVIARDVARRKRWREGAARVRAWAQQRASMAAVEQADPVTA